MQPTELIISSTFYTGTLTEDLFEKKYLACRQKEQRVYTDEEVRSLPFCTSNHPHYKEWLLRKKTAKKLHSYFTTKKKPITLLEIGCGNGWLSHQLSTIPRINVTGLDINFTEIKQATRVFNNDTKLKFVYGHLHSEIMHRMRFDVILFAASIQYFPLEEILCTCLPHLKPSGEIHIVDSPFYDERSVRAARTRSIAYYDKLGFAGMEDHYYHHTFSELKPFDPEILYDPHSFPNRFLSNQIPFHWVRIKKDVS